MLQTQGGIAGKSSNHRYSRGEKRKGVSIRPTVYDTICAEEKLAIWEGSVTHAQYFEDPLVLDKRYGMSSAGLKHIDNTLY